MPLPPPEPHFDPQSPVLVLLLPASFPLSQPLVRSLLRHMSSAPLEPLALTPHEWMQPLPEPQLIVPEYLRIVCER